MTHLSPRPIQCLLRLAAVALAGLLCLAPAASAGQVFSGRVVGVPSGDRLYVLPLTRSNPPGRQLGPRRGAGQILVQLFGVDAPEAEQPFGLAAWGFATRLASGQLVSVEVREQQGRDRVKGVVRLPDGRQLNREVVQAGMGWWLTEEAPNEVALSLAESAARQGRVGLWSQQKPLPPWEWRRLKGR